MGAIGTTTPGLPRSPAIFVPEAVSSPPVVRTPWVVGCVMLLVASLCLAFGQVLHGAFGGGDRQFQAWQVRPVLACAALCSLIFLLVGLLMGIRRLGVGTRVVVVAIAVAAAGLSLGVGYAQAHTRATMAPRMLSLADAMPVPAGLRVATAPAVDRVSASSGPDGALVTMAWQTPATTSGAVCAIVNRDFAGRPGWHRSAGQSAQNCNYSRVTGLVMITLEPLDEQFVLVSFVPNVTSS